MLLRNRVPRAGFLRIAFFVIMFAVWLTFLAYSDTPETNLIVNPGFEDGLEGWSRGFGSAGVIHDLDASVYRSGSTSLRLSSTDPTHRGCMYQDIRDFEPGHKYKMQWRRRTEAVSVPGPWGAFVRISVFDQDGLIGNSHYVGRQEEGTRNWETVEYIFQVPIDAIRIRVELFLDRATGTVWWDDLALWRLPPDPALQPAQSFEEYGAQANPTGNPIGGGQGYTYAVTSGDIAVSSAQELIAALEAAAPGDVIYVDPDAEIDLTGYEQLVIREGVTLAGNRGVDGAPGPLLFSDEMDTYPLFVMEKGARLTGIRLRGPDGTTQDSAYSQPNSLAVRSAGDDIEVDNNEIFNWSYGGVSVMNENAYVHHNHIHHVQRAGLGYPVVVSGGTALIEANYFDWYRHAIASSGYIGSGYEARYNIAGANATSFAFDMHGGRDFCPKRSTPCSETEKFMGGEWITIHHNTFLNTRQRAIGIRGVPLQGGAIYRNWFHHTDTNYAVGFVNYLGNVDVYDNVYGPQRLSVPLQLERTPLVLQCSGWCDLFNKRLPLVTVVDPIHIGFVNPEPGTAVWRVSGELPIDVEVDVGTYLNVTDVTISIGDRVVYTGSFAPEPGTLLVDTRDFEDGSYPLRLSVYDPDRGTLFKERPLRIVNWWEMSDALEPPRELGWFGTIDMSRTTEESAGWTYATDDPEIFFGDEDRKMRVEDSTEYLVWEAANLREFSVTVYAKGDAGTEEVTRRSVILEGRQQDGTWIPLPYGIERVDSSDEWYMLELSGNVDSAVRTTELRLTVKQGVPSDSWALGQIVLRGLVD
ncbi:MAG: carbohydrate binding domain-containing protein [Limnochordia bacterium]